METILNFTTSLNLQRLIIDHRNHQFLPNITRLFDSQLPNNHGYRTIIAVTPFPSRCDETVHFTSILQFYSLLYFIVSINIERRFCRTGWYFSIFCWLSIWINLYPLVICSSYFYSPGIPIRNGFRIIQNSPSTYKYRPIATKNTRATYFARWKHHSEDCTGCWQYPSS